MEQCQKTRQKSIASRTRGLKARYISRMSSNTEKVADNQLVSAYKDSNESQNSKNLTHNIEDKYINSKDDPEKQKEFAENNNKGNETDKNECDEVRNYLRYRHSGKERLGENDIQDLNITNDNKTVDIIPDLVVDPADLPDVPACNPGRDEVDIDIDNNLPSTAILLTTPGGSKVYVVGTVHYSLKSQDDVARLIRAVQPNYVILELCKTRSVMLQWDEERVFKEAQNMNLTEAMRKAFQLGFLEGLFFITLFSLSIRMTKQLGIAPGGEFRIAFKEAQEVPNCEVLFGDLPIALTLMRLFSTLSFWQVLKIVGFFLFNNKKMSQEDVEKYRKMDEIEKMILQLSKESPDIARVLVSERDAALTYSMQIAAERNEPNKVVGVVGLGHLLGIKENWGKVTKEHIREITKVPPPKRRHKVLKYTLKFTAVGLLLYGIHKMASRTAFYTRFFSDDSYWNLSNILYDFWDTPVVHNY